MWKKGLSAGAIVVLCFLNTICVQAQNQPENQEKWQKYGLQYRTFRFALIPGLSTNGIDATEYASKYSFNILAGYNGALEEGFEFGSLVNANKYYAHGVQIAGLGNFSGHETAGIQLAGIGNYSGEDMTGIQLAGIGNWSSGNMTGLQFSNVFNISQGEYQGVQGAGILNLSFDDMSGIIMSGVGNISGENMEGLLFSGVFNIAGAGMSGIIGSGILNYSESFQGISLSTINISKEFEGIQFGSINVAEKAAGIQIGIINYADSFEGLPVGIISYYGNGRTNFDIWTTETGFTNLGLKLGTNEVYNMISIGYNSLLDRDVWQLGWSIGRLHEYEHHFLYNDFSYFKINEGGWTKDLNSLFKYRLLFGKELANYFKLYGGPTFNMLISSLDQSDDYAPYRLFDFGAKGRDYIFWIGFSLGFEVF